MLDRDARAELLVLAVGLTLHELAPDCLSNVRLHLSDGSMSVGVQWHHDGIHGPVGLPVVTLPIEASLTDPRGVEELAREIVGPEAGRHLLQHG